MRPSRGLARCGVGEVSPLMLHCWQDKNTIKSILENELLSDLIFRYTAKRRAVAFIYSKPEESRTASIHRESVEGSRVQQIHCEEARKFTKVARQADARIPEEDIILPTVSNTKTVS